MCAQCLRMTGCMAVYTYMQGCMAGWSQMMWLIHIYSYDECVVVCLHTRSAAGVHHPGISGPTTLWQTLLRLLRD